MVPRIPGSQLNFMTRFVKRSSKKAGLPPGTLVHIGDQKADETEISLLHFDAEQLHEKKLADAEAAFAYRDTSPVTWVNVDGLHDVGLIEKIGERFGIHPLTLEDIVNTGHRPKAEDFENYLFVVVKMISYDETRQHISAEQVSIIFSEKFLLSFQELPGDVFDGVRERIRRAKGRIRKSGCDYLAYALVDAVVDHYFVVLERLGDSIERLETELLEKPEADTLRRIHHLKRELVYLRKQVWPLREAVNLLVKDENAMIKDGTRVFLRDVYDHCIYVSDTIESLRDLLSGMLDLYMSTVSNRMNEVMKVLTIIATIFIPLTFIAGIYGMNFKFMPELEWRWSYPLLWLVLIVIFGAMIFYFKRKKWL